MKKFLSVASIAMIAVAVFTGCSKSSSTSSATGSLKATAGTTSVNSNFCEAGYVDSTLSITGTSITSSTASYPYIILGIYGWNGTSTGTFAIGGSNLNLATYAVSSTVSHEATSGTITITSVSSTQISGTFSFVGGPTSIGGSDSVSVTNGSFTAKGTGL